MSERTAPGRRLHELRDEARTFDCEIVTRQLIDGLARDQARCAREVRELRRENAQLRDALAHEPWWRRWRAP